MSLRRFSFRLMRLGRYAGKNMVVSSSKNGRWQMAKG